MDVSRMSRGTPMTRLRLSDDLLRRIQESITSNNAFRADEPNNIKSWIRKAIEERLAKLDRSRKGRGKREAPAEADQDERQPGDQGQPGDRPGDTHHAEAGPAPTPTVTPGPCETATG